MIELNVENFKSEVTDYQDKPVFVDFWGDKCQVCIELMPEVHGLESKYNNEMKFASLNIGGARRLAISQKVLALPTMIIYDKGERAASITSDKIKTIKDVEEFIKSYLDSKK